MFIIFISAMLIFFISLVVMLLASLMSKKKMFDREKISPFECGFDPFKSSRIPFSIRFFLISIIFLIFDIEITLILPMIIIFKYCSILNWIYSSMIFIVTLIVGLYHEWNQGALNWTN